MAGDRDSATNRLVQSATRGDGEALRTLLERYLPELRAFVRLNMGPALRAREDPEDIEQSVCREVLADLDKFTNRGDDAFRQWLNLNALNKLRDRARYHGRQRRNPARERSLPNNAEDLSGYAHLLTPSGVAVQRESVARLHAAFEQLSESQRAVITMSKMLAMSHADIGVELGCSANSAAVQLHRALARLGVLLADEEE